MKARVFYLILVSICLLSVSVGCSKQEVVSPIPDKVFKESPWSTSMEELISEELPEGYYSYFILQNDSDHPMWIGMTYKLVSGVMCYFVEPGYQMTEMVMLEPWPGIKELVIETLTELGWIDCYYDVPGPNDPNSRVPNQDTDIFAYYYQFNLKSNKATPDDPSQWKFEKFSDHRVRWTYRFTNEDYDEAVRQTEKRHNAKVQG